MIESSPRDNRPTTELTSQRLTRMITKAFFAWFLVSYLSIMASDAPGTKFGPLVMGMLFALWTFPAYASIATIASWILKRFGKAKQACYVLAIPAFAGAVICWMLIMPIAVCLATGEGPLVISGGFLLSLVAATAFIFWSFFETPKALTAKTTQDVC